MFYEYMEILVSLSRTAQNVHFSSADDEFINFPLFLQLAALS